jgi:hypothetical protein
LGRSSSVAGRLPGYVVSGSALALVIVVGADELPHDVSATWSPLLAKVQHGSVLPAKLIDQLFSPPSLCSRSCGRTIIGSNPRPPGRTTATIQTQVDEKQRDWVVTLRRLGRSQTELAGVLGALAEALPVDHPAVRRNGREEQPPVVAGLDGRRYPLSREVR